VPNRSGEDPHEAPRRAPLGQQQKSAFLSVGGMLIEPAPGPPYFAFGWDGVTGL
jgi:serine/threonine protein kinase HipA of HipAB toxin-antitoxin module